MRFRSFFYILMEEMEKMEKNQKLEVNTYVNGAICIWIWDEAEEESVIDITTNLDRYMLSAFSGFVDVSNSEAARIIEDLKIGKPTGAYGFSGMSCYMLYTFDRKRLEELDPDGVKMYVEQEELICG